MSIHHPPKTTFPPTAQQVAFLDALLTTSDHIALLARAGCGKTSTILLAVDALVRKFPTAEITVCAYNKAIADEVSGKLKAAGHTDWKTVQAQTLHGMGWGLLRFAFKSAKIDDKKVANLVSLRNDDLANHFASQICSLVRYAKQAGFGFFPDVAIGSKDAWYALADHFDVNSLDDTSLLDEIVEAAQGIYRQSLNQTDIIDFDDMILFPLIKNLRVRFGRDFLFLDEAQDLSRARQALARKFLKPSGRMIVVGDDRQAIYGFSGADAAALQNLCAQLAAKVLPLSVTWRCPQAIVREAQRFVPDIVAAPNAQEGAVNSLPAFTPELIASLTPSDAILCRNTAPLIKLAYALIRAGKPAKVEGRAIGDGLKKLSGRWKVKMIDALINRLGDYREREIQKANAKGSEAKAEEVADRVDTLLEICYAVLAKGQKTVTDVDFFIDSLFADGATGVTTLATYHRSKGREWKNVFLFEHAARCPSKAARQPWQISQENNLAYVAITRAMETLTYVG